MIGPLLEYELDIELAPRLAALTDGADGQRYLFETASELGVVFDRADARLWITGWRGRTSVNDAEDPSADPGLSDGFAEPRFDDRSWEGMLSPAHHWYDQRPVVRWARTHVFLPETCRDKKLTLVLGGVGLFDYNWLRVFLNGLPVGEREESGRWRNPGAFDLGPDGPVHRALHFGGDNVIAVQLAEHISRSPALDEVDPGRTRLLPLRSQWPAQFEQYVVVGEPEYIPALRTTGVENLSEGRAAEVRVSVEAEDIPLKCTLTYRWDADDPVIRRETALQLSGEPLRLLRIDLLRAYSKSLMPSDGEQGFPVYLQDRFFAGVEHPAGWAIGTGGEVILRQYPGRMVQPGVPLAAMPIVLGARGAGGPRAAFLEHLTKRMRRTARGHLKPKFVVSPFGWDYDPATSKGGFTDLLSEEPTQEIILADLARLADARLQEGLSPDTYVIIFWVDSAGDTTFPDRRRFPDGFRPIREAAEAIGADLGLWQDSSMAAWTIGENPLVSGNMTHDPGYGTERMSLCRAAEPFNTLTKLGYVHQVATERVKLIRFDNLQSICYSTAHAHLPGIWSTEAIMDAALEGLRAIDAAAPDAFLMLYWGYRSPWWLLWADTLFEPGIAIEAAHPAADPTLYVRDSVVQGLDQAQRFCVDVPTLGKDSLGVWLSRWKWNSSIGSERWQEAVVMDLCRGNLLLQIVSDEEWLTSEDRRVLARFHALLRDNAEAFGHSLAIGGDPWRGEPYGYVCSDGRTAFVALNNVTWSDAYVRVRPDELGLPIGRNWEIIRHHPKPARLAFSVSRLETRGYPLRPFDVALLQIRAADNPVDQDAWPQAFHEPSVTLSVTLEPSQHAPALPSRKGLRLRSPKASLGPRQSFLGASLLPQAYAGGTAAVWLRLYRDGALFPLEDVGAYFAARATVDGHAVEVSPVVRDHTYSAPWQAWRVAISPAMKARKLSMRIGAQTPPGVELEAGGAFIPNDQSDTDLRD